MAEVIEKNFSYTGNIQSYTIPVTGLYQLEVWGACGGDHTYPEGYAYGGSGGYSKGYKKLNKGTIIYVCCGGVGAEGHYSSESATAYNGGAKGGAFGTYGDYDRACGGGGGGATHIALVTGTLTQIGKTKFDQNGLIVAGGGGGATFGHNGASGGGLQGGSSYAASGGTQTSGYKFGQGEGGHSGNDNISGNGCSGTGGGGGGYYGGHSGEETDKPTKPGGGGGSGYIGGVPTITYGGHTYTPITQQGGNVRGAGRAKISLAKKSTLKLGNLDCTVFLGNKEISCFLGDKEL